MAEPPDWRSQQTERVLSTLERQGFAWEFLRRNPDYRTDYNRLRIPTTSRAGFLPGSVDPHWGLHFPDRSQPLCS